MLIKSLLAAAFSAAALTFAPSASAGDEVIVRAWDYPDDVVITEVVRTDDVFLPPDAPIPYDPFADAVYGACYLDDSYIESLYYGGPVCRDVVTGEAVVAVEDDTVWGLPVDRAGLRAYEFY